MKCEGYRKKGGLMAFGPVKWVRCKKSAIVLLTGTQGKNKKFKIPACITCWDEALSHEGIKILSTKPLKKEGKK